ncbi:riboflavin biosynthesis protein RibF [Chitinophagaceae bacterium IBVUCB1]|nr:riboflavin biosynthesis protein RibF [Chitinophagaceae bacterium IBVUCB1]
MAVFYNTDELKDFDNAVITIGTFDGVHLGHLTILQQVVAQAKASAGESIVLTFEPHPRKLLFPQQPIHIITPLQEKIKLLTDAGIDHVFVVPFTKEFAALSAEAYIKDFLVKHLHPKGIVIGYDHQFGHDRAGNIALLQSFEQEAGYTVFEIPAKQIEDAAISSTKIRHALAAGQVTDAAQMLGRHYCLKGRVIEGAKLGRQLGYPTANIQPTDAEQIIPNNGVYVIKVVVEGKICDGMMNIGIRPTVSNELSLHIEAHLFGFNSDIYKQEVEIQFVQRLRDEQRFPSLDALKEQLNKDAENAKRVLAVL